MFGSRATRSRRHYDRATALSDAGDLDAAAHELEKVLKADPGARGVWFDLGLVHKSRRDWPNAVRCNRAALALGSDPAGDPAWWNLGIAATALHDWPAAREAWRGYGIDVPDGDGELVMDLGPVPLRVALDGATEVVWCTRLDPARGRIENVPSLAGGRRWHDVVLHDGVPTGTRTSNDRPVPVFDEIEVWRRSDVPTNAVEVVADAAEVADLTEAAESAGLAAQDWTASVRLLCDSCSRGEAPAEHSHGFVSDPSRRERRLGVAAPPERVGPMLAEWAARHPGVEYGTPVTQ